MSAANAAYHVAANVADPEMPMLTLADLGILRSVEQDGDAVTVTITPTYSGCPALAVMAADLDQRLRQAGFGPVTVRTVLSPPWGSDDITAAGRAKLAAAGLAAPNPVRRGSWPRGAGAAPGKARPVPLTLTGRPAAVSCPQCTSRDTELVARFGSTACKALHRCRCCGEPFEKIKEL